MARAQAGQPSRSPSYSVVEDTPILICRFLPGGKITFVNQTYCEYFAKTQEELVGSNFLSLIPESDREAVMANISTLTAESPTQSHEHQVIAPGGDIRWQRWSNRGLFDDRGQIVVYQSIGEDITERKQTEEELKKYREGDMLSNGAVVEEILPEGVRLSYGGSRFVYRK